MTKLGDLATPTEYKAPPTPSPLGLSRPGRPSNEGPIAKFRSVGGSVPTRPYTTQQGVVPHLPGRLSEPHPTADRDDRPPFALLCHAM